MSPEHGRAEEPNEGFTSVERVPVISPGLEKDGRDPEKVDPISTVDDTDSEYDIRKENHFGEVTVIDNAKDLITHVLHVDDDPSASPWTFRAVLIGEYSSEESRGKRAELGLEAGRSSTFAEQVSFSVSSHPCSRRSSTSSLRSSSCRWCS